MTFPSLLDLKLGAYPGWVQTLMFSTALIWLVLWTVLVWRSPPPPPPEVEWIELTRVIEGLPAGAMGFTATFLNNTGKTVVVRSLTLMYFEDEVPTSGLQSANEVDTVYRVARGADGPEAFPPDGPSRPVSVTLEQPYDGQPFMEAVVPLDEFIADGAKARVMLVLEDADVLDPRTRMLRVEASFSNGSVAHKDLALRP